MIFKVGILGATGRMGQEISACIAKDFERQGIRLELADAVAADDSITSVDGVTVRTLEDPPREPVHGWIDFSTPAATLALLEATREPVVIGTTGFSKSQLERIESAAQSRPILLSANMSPGIALVKRMLKQVMPSEYWDVTLSEWHHREKKDAPSGTALELAKVMRAMDWTVGEIRSIRAGGVPGIHSIELVAESERVEIRHDVWNRRVFAEGACLAALFLFRQKQPKLYCMEDVFA